MTQTEQKEDGDRIHGVVHFNIVTLPELLFEEQARLTTTRGEKEKALKQRYNTHDSKFDATRDS